MSDIMWERHLYGTGNSQTIISQQILQEKACQFTITVNSISEQNVPELTDEWVANNSKKNLKL